MPNLTLLEAFLLLNVFVMGAVAVFAIQHLHAHFKPRPDEAEPPKPHHTQQTAHLPQEVRDRLIEAAQANFQLVLDRSVATFQRDLQSTTTQLNKKVEKLGEAIINGEVSRYEADLERLLKQAETTLSGAQADLATHQTELKAKMAEEIAAEKQQLLQQIDTKLADAVASFLTETLQHNVDLGAQNDYLLAMLEEHKADFVRGVDDETKAAR